MKTVKFAQVLKFSENLVKVDKPEEERYVTVLLYGRGVIEREIKEGKVPVAFTGYKAHAGQLIISTINARNGAAGIIPTELEGSVVSKDFPLFDIDRECVDEQYLLYYLWSDSFIHEAEQNSFGATMPRLHVKPFLNMQMRLPTLSEQKRRAHTLCHVESLLNTQRHLLTKLDELVKSRFVEMFGEPVSNTFGWKQLLLCNVTSKIGSGATPKGGKESYQAEGITLIRSMNVHDGRFEYKDLAHITDEQATQLNNVIVQENDVFINITGASVARSCIVPSSVLPARVNQHVAIIRCVPERLNAIFANNMFLNDRFKGQLLDIGESGGATRQAITKQQLENLTIIVPPLELQNRFAAFVTEVDKSKLAVKQSLEKLETLKKSLMQQYFG